MMTGTKMEMYLEIPLDKMRWEIGLELKLLETEMEKLLEMMS
jgi:hypothetical protein